jgi:hypothetical protein
MDLANALCRLIQVSVVILIGAPPGDLLRYVIPAGLTTFRPVMKLNAWSHEEAKEVTPFFWGGPYIAR